MSALLKCMPVFGSAVQSVGAYSFQLSACFGTAVYVVTCSADRASLLVCLHGDCNRGYACFGIAAHFCLCHNENASRKASRTQMCSHLSHRVVEQH